MKKEINLGQLIVTAIGILITVVTAWITLREDVARIETVNKFQDSRIESMQIEMKSNYNELRNDIRSLHQSVNDVKVLIERKADRK